MLTQRLTSTNAALDDRHAVWERTAGIHTWRDGFFENSDELHSVHRLPSLSSHGRSLARSVVSVAAQHTGRILLLPRSSVGSSHGAGSVATRETGVPRCSVGVFLLGWCKKFQRLWRRVTSRSFTAARLHPVLSGGKRPRASLPRKDITHLRQGDVPHSPTVGYF